MTERERVRVLTLGLLLLFQTLLCGAGAAPGSSFRDDEIDWEALPGAPASLAGDFRMYSGHVSISDTKNVFYWFVESQGLRPAEDPVVFWTNGGPGCSGLLALLTEHGPFSVRKSQDTGDLELEPNPYSWNKVAHMLYVEQPVGVGFSYSQDPSEYETGDGQAAADNYAFIQAWLDRFPHYRSNEFFLSSESYGGHYVPTLAHFIQQESSKEKDAERVINFGGFLVGNPFTDAASNTVAQYQRYWGENLISRPLYDAWMSKCVRNGFRPDLPECDQLQEAMDRQIANLNPYALDYPVCTQSSPQAVWLKHHLGKAKHLLGDESPPQYEPCAEVYIVDYLNMPEVQRALHIGDADNFDWSECSEKVRYSQADVQSPVMSYYPAIVEAAQNAGRPLRILVYSGDDDAICATSGTQWWIWDLGFKATSSWEPWILDGQLAGFETRFDQLTFVTVHRSGHEVPAYTPVSALELFARFIDGSWFDPVPPTPSSEMK